MRFHFQLETVLKLRLLQEKQAEERLEQALQRIRALERQLEEAQSWSEQTARARGQSGRLPAIEAQFVEQVLGRTRQAMAAVHQQMEEERRRAETLRRAYLKAHREREKLSTLRAEAVARFRLEEARRDQLALDEIFLGKLLYARSVEDREGADGEAAVQADEEVEALDAVARAAWMSMDERADKLNPMTGN